jgi:hypothetical protein
VLFALVSKLLIIILQYLAGLLLSIEEVLHVGLRSLQLIDAGLKLCNQKKAKWVKLLQGTTNKYSARQWRTFILVAERLVLPHQIVALRLHCRMDLPGPTTSVGTRTDYSMGP